MCNSSMAIMGSMPRAHGPVRNWIALLGRGEADADGVQDYCEYLARALEQHGVVLRLVRVTGRVKVGGLRFASSTANAKLGKDNGSCCNSLPWRGRVMEFLSVRLRCLR